MIENQDLVKINEAAIIVGKTPDNIRDYIQRKKISKYNENGEKISFSKNGELRVSLNELRVFLALVRKGDEKHHHAGLHPELGFHDLPEYKRTKHVHRLHPYLGKFIPQLVEWFLSRYFEPDNIILDPFMGSGTTLVQGNEMKMHTIGIDISYFNFLISKVKIDKYDVNKARYEILDIEKRVSSFSNQLNESVYSKQSLIPNLNIQAIKEKLITNCQSDYLKSWFAPKTLLEMLYYRDLIQEYDYQDLLRVVLSRAVRSSRLIPHYDLATPKNPLPVGEKYWCRKHNRYCVPIDNCIKKIHAYSGDTVRRLEEFDKLRSDRIATIIRGDSRHINLGDYLINSSVKNRLIDGIFTSPPYVGQIDYHDQHIYAYELFGYPRQDELEIGPKKIGKSIKAQNDYVNGISSVFINIRPFLKESAKIFIVANDRFNLYPSIAQKSGMRIVDRFERAVTKRTEQGDNPYQETIFYLTKGK